MLLLCQVPIMLRRLHELRSIQEEEGKSKKKPASAESNVRHFANIGCHDGSTQEEAVTAVTTNGISCAPATSSTPNADSVGAEGVEIKTPLKAQDLDVSASAPTDSTKSSSQAAAAAAFSQIVSSVTPTRSPAKSGLGGCGTPGASPGRSADEGSYRSSLKRSLSPGHSAELNTSKRSRQRQDSYGGGRERVLLCFYSSKLSFPQNHRNHKVGSELNMLG